MNLLFKGSQRCHVGSGSGSLSTQAYSDMLPVLWTEYCSQVQQTTDDVWKVLSAYSLLIFFVYGFSSELVGKTQYVFENCY